MKSKMLCEPGSHELVNSHVHVWPVQARLIANKGDLTSPLKHNQNTNYMGTGPCEDPASLETWAGAQLHSFN
jgi:hypothetical protein